jgi:hypothetical protein
MGSPGSEAIGMIDMGSASENRGNQGEHFAAWSSTTDAINKTHLLVHKTLETEAHHQSRGHDQSGIGYQSRVVEGHSNPIDPARY